METKARSNDLFSKALRLLPGGVNSPVRAFSAVGGDPFFVERASGAALWDVEGRRYHDYVMSWGALMLGHAHPRVTAALTEAVGRGTSFGTPAPAEVELAELVTETVPSVEMVRFVNSGTEATMAAVRLARGVTGRDLVVKFTGCYHGHGDSFLVQAGSGVATLGLPNSPGVPAEMAQLTLTSPFNDLDAVETLFHEFAGRIACVIIEPIMGNAGLIPPVDGFLQGLRQLTSDGGALLIFDEVMTGFRVALGGAQERFGVLPDLTTLGKVVGGGLPVGAYGGRRELMEQVAPVGPVYQAGTLSGNPLAMAAGIAQVTELRSEPPYAKLEERGRRIVDGLGEVAAELGVPMSGRAIGGMWGVHFAKSPVYSFEDAQRGADTTFFARFFQSCLARGVYLPPSAFEASFLSTAHDDDVIDTSIEAMRDALREAAT